MDGHTQAPENVPSPVATGGGGERFEQRVGAYALALLLTRSPAPVIMDSVVTSVGFQTRHLGWRTDDVLIVGEVRPGVTRKLAIQAKRSITISAKDEECVQTICGMWDDFVAAERFDPALDRLAIATLYGTATLHADFSSLLSCARAAPSAKDFRRRLSLSGHPSQKAKKQNEALLSMLGAHLAGTLDEDRYWEFLRVVTVVDLDLGTVTSQMDASIVALLAHAVAEATDPIATASATWARLLDVSSEGRQSAATYGRDDLPADLRNLHHAIQTADERAFRELVAHGRSVRRSIRATIAGTYTLERATLADAALNALEAHRVAVVAGAAGSGKSALATVLLDSFEAERPVLAFQAVEFSTANINKALSMTETALRALLAAHDQTIILIDGVERLLEHPVRDAFTHLLQMVAETTSLRLVMTCRDYSLDTVRSSLLEPQGLTHAVAEVGPLSDEELDVIAAKVAVLAPPLGDARMRAFLRTPYLLNMASRLDWADTSLPENVRSFREKCWREVIRDEAHNADSMPSRREKAFTSVARQRAAELRPYVRPGIDDPQALDALFHASLLDRSPASDRLYAPAHDVLEDWAILKWLEDEASAADDPPVALAAAVGGLPSMRRGLRRWLGEGLEVDPVAGTNLVLEVSGRTDVPQYFRDDCIVAALLSEAATSFLEGCRQRIAAGDTALLRQVVHLLRVACKTVPWWLPRGGLPSAMLVPTGPAWPSVLELVTQYMPTKPDGDALLVLGLVEDWARQVTVASPAPAGADAAGRIVSALALLLDRSWKDDARERALKVLLTIPRHAPAFEDLAQRALASDREDRAAEEFADLALSTLSSAYVSRDHPDFMIALLRARLMLRDDDLARNNNGWSSPLGVDECFGFRRQGRNEFFPASALQGPFWALFQHHPRKALDLVIELSNHAGEWYGERKWPGNELEEAERITIDVPGHGLVEQWFSGRLYALHRGMTVGPYVLQSALMAMESWLLAVAKTDGVDLESWLLDILARSNSALTTAVVASVCVAHPTQSGRAAWALLSSRDLFGYDRHRLAAEGSTSIEFLAGLNPSHQIYEAERRAANALSHRRDDLEALALKLQLTEQREEVWALIDKHRAELAGKDPEAAGLWRLALHRMDIRGFRVAEARSGPGGPRATDTVASKDMTAAPETAAAPDAAEVPKAPESPAAPEFEQDREQHVYLMPGDLEPDLLALVDESQRRLKTVNRHVGLRLAAQKAWENRPGPEAAGWRPLLAEAQAIAEQDDDMDIFARGGPGIAAAVCIRDQLDALNPDERAWCIARVTRELSEGSNDRDEMSVRSRLFGPDRAAAAVVPLLVARVPEQLPVNATDLLVQALTHPADEVVEYAYSGAGAFLGAEHRDLALRCAAAAAREAAVLEEAAAVLRKRDPFETAPEVDAAPLVAAAVRGAVTGSVEEAKAALAALRFDTWHGRAAAIRAWHLILARPESAEARAFAGRAAAWLAETWGENRRNRKGQERDFQGEHGLSRQIVRFALKLPNGAALEVSAPLIALTATEPREVATFVEHMIVEADGGAGDSFWALWQAFADRAASAEWAARLGRERPYEEALINRLFMRVPWKEGTTHWARLEDNAHRVHTLATRLPAAVVCVEAYLHFLYTIGRRGLPDAFKIVQSVLERAENSEVIFTSEVMFILESLLGLFVYGQPLRLKREVALREAVLKLLDQLVSAGSSAAYRMRDDFVTPFREASS